MPKRDQLTRQTYRALTAIQRRRNGASVQLRDIVAEMGLTPAWSSKVGYRLELLYSDGKVDKVVPTGWWSYGA